MTKAATRFLNEVETSWDTLNHWEDSVNKGLSDVDLDTIWDYCQEANCDYLDTQADVMRVIRAKVIRAKILL